MMPSFQYERQSCSTGSMPLPFSSLVTKHSKKNLRFQPNVTVQPVDCTMTREEKSRSYYTKAELNTFSLEAEAIRTLSTDLSYQSFTCTQHALQEDYLLGLEADPALRGLELYLCPIRVRNKGLVRKALLKCHRNLKVSPNKSAKEQLQTLASASVKFSQWSRQIALETARLDSLRACEVDDYAVPVNEPIDIAPFPATTRRRRVTCDASSQPCKKRIIS